MMERMTREKIKQTIAERIHFLMEELLVYNLQEQDYHLNFNSNIQKERFNLLKELSAITKELLDDRDIKARIINEAKKSSANGENCEEKYEFLIILRNILLHASFSDSYDDILISKEILTWNTPRNVSILKYFSKNDGKELENRIYLKNNNSGKYEEIKKVKINIKSLEDGTEYRLCDIISLSDAIWCFSLIDYYLDYIGIDIDPQYRLSL